MLSLFQTLLLGDSKHSKYLGCVWKAPLQDDEFTILLILFREVAFAMDYSIYQMSKLVAKFSKQEVKHVSYRGTADPMIEFPRQLVSLWKLARVVMFYYIFKYFLFFFVYMVLGL